MRVRVALIARALTATALLFSVLLLTPASAFASRTLGLSSGAFHFDLAAGQQAKGSVVVLNTGTEPLKVMVYASDQTVDAKGNITYQTPTRLDLESLALPASWTTIKMPANSKALGNIPYLDIPPGARIPVSFSILVPPTVPPGDHDVYLFFESFVPPAPGQGAQSTIAGRLGARVTLRVAGTFVRKIEVRPFNVPAYVLGGEIPYDFTIRNLGNVDQRLGGRVTLFDRTGNEVLRKTVIDGRTSFAGTNIESSDTLLVDKMPIGPFKVKVEVSPVDDAGNATNSGADTVSVSHDVWLIPFWLVALVAILVVLIFVRIVWVVAVRATRKRAQREQEKLAAAGQRPFPDDEYES